MLTAPVSRSRKAYVFSTAWTAASFLCCWSPEANYSILVGFSAVMIIVWWVLYEDERRAPVKNSASLLAHRGHEEMLLVILVTLGDIV